MATPPTLRASMSSSFRVLLLSSVLLAACGGGGGGGGGGGPVSPPTVPSAFVLQAGIVRAAPGSGSVRVDFVAPAAGFEVAAFVATVRANVFATAPRTPTAGQTRITIGSLTNGTRYFLGLGIRPTGSGAYTPTGPIVTAIPRAPIHVDAAAAPGGNGSTPALAFVRLEDGIAAARTAGGGNVWVKAGRYALPSTTDVFAGVSVLGGFGPAFDLATRDPAATPTIVDAPTGVEMLRCADRLDNGLSATLDGLQLEGNRRGLVGVDVDSTDPCQVELRGVSVVGMRDRGIRARNANDNEYEFVVTGCRIDANGADGLSGSGPFDYTIFDSQFAGNAQEGIELDPLSPQTGTKVTLDVEACHFFSNGAEGLDCTLGTPLVPTNGEYSVRIRACAFEQNRLGGCLIDGDFEANAGYSGSIVLRESRSNANGGDGFLIDLDVPDDTTRMLTAFAHRVSATANDGHGLHVTSEERPGLLTVSTSAFVGNTGAGVRAEGTTVTGNGTVVATHCVFSANGAGGLTSRDVPAAALSSIAYRQASAFGANVQQVGNVTTSDPAAIAFQSAPEDYLRVTSRSGAILTLATPAGFNAAAMVELDDDGTLRPIAAVAGSGTQVTLTAEPTTFSAPGVLAAFATGTADASEDWNLAGGSIALGAGLDGADAGPLGSSAPGQPGVADAQGSTLLSVDRTVPGLSQAIGSGAAIAIDFSSPLQGSSANATTVRAFRGASAINVTLSTSANRLTVSPASGNWGAGDFRLELDGVRDTSGNTLSGALALPIRR